MVATARPRRGRADAGSNLRCSPCSGVGDAPSGGRDELFRAWRTFFERLASTGPVGLLFEDLQWADTGPARLHRPPARVEPRGPHPDHHTRPARIAGAAADWGAGRRNFLALGLEPLTSEAMRDLLAGLVPGLPESTVRSIVARADGIPLYAVETIRMLVSDGRLREVDGRYEPVGELGDLAVPETLRPSSRPVSTHWPRRIGRCSRTPPCWGRASRSPAWLRCPARNRPCSSDACAI